MFSAIRRRFTYANIIMTFALVFAMTGGAYAAHRYLITSTKQISPKVLKALAGKTGPTGPQGPGGAQGPVGPTGTKGENGTEGKEGKEGKSGTSVTSTAFASSKGTCKEGGSEFKIGTGTPTYACNGVAGKEGPKGDEGSPWTAGGTLPQGASEHGVFVVAATPVKVIFPSNYVAFASISFTIPLAAPLTNAEEKAHVILEGEPDPKGCKGTLEKPEAESRNLCIFERGFRENAGSVAVRAPETPEAQAGENGTLLEVKPEMGNETKSVFVYGAWVVTG